ncbi:hypothetical protein [Streptomyces diastatochromogenes]|nr:hypothetical protein [Streptomyces diastatochromogenes]MCZ0991649.1 hypothetical protein [Streptomyces diastatochromogenes]
MVNSSALPTAPGRAILLGALIAIGAALLLLQLGAGHTPSSRSFADLPEFATWIWAYAAEVGAAVAIGIATLPVFRVLAEQAGRRTTALMGSAWLVFGTLIAVFGPRALDESNPLWLGTARFLTINALTWVFITPSFAGLLLVQVRQSALADDIASAVEDGKAGQLIVELLWLRAAMLRFLLTFATAITGGVLALGALRGALLAHGTPADDVPVLRLLTYGGVFTVTAAFIFVPAYLAWQEQVFALRDALYPVPEDGRPSHDWFDARDSFDTLLAARVSAGRVLTAVFGVLAPLAGSVVSALLSANH